MKFYTKYNPPKHEGFATEGESLTRQSEADACDINKIMERFDRTGQLPVSMKAPPRFGDARMVDFQTAKQIVIEAENAFKELPAETRKYFGHDPKNMLEAISNATEADKADLLKLGIIVEKQTDPVDVLQQIAKNTEKVDSKPAN
ncbi:scaffold protein [Microviridae sp.]|nr:scaffold protein [Microviridae sp.]